MGHADSASGNMASEGFLKVACWRADTLLAAGEVEAPDVIKIDVEGAKANVLRGARGGMEQRPVVFLATHGETAHRACFELLAASGYKVRALDGSPPEGTDEVLAVGVNRGSGMNRPAAVSKSGPCLRKP